MVLTKIAVASSSRTLCKAPTSFHVTSGTVAKPSLLLDGCTRFIAISKSFWFISIDISWVNTVESMLLSLSILFEFSLLLIQSITYFKLEKILTKIKAAEWLTNKKKFIYFFWQYLVIRNSNDSQNFKNGINLKKTWLTYNL